MDEDRMAVERLRAGEEQALVSLMESYREPVYRLALRYLANTADAGEVTEETFVRVYFNASRYKPGGTVRSWIFTIVANLCRDRLRRRKKHRGLQSLSARSGGEATPALEEILADPLRDAAEAAEGAEHLGQIHHAIQALPEKLKFAFIFCVLEEHSHEEAAEVLGCSVKTVEMRIYRARQHLRKQLK